MATKPRHLKTPLQLWIVDNRKRLGLTPADLARLTDVTVDTARGWESRGAPSEDALAILQRRFGVPLPDDRQTVAGSDAAMLDLAAAIRDLVEELRLSRLAQVSATTVAFEALGALGGRLDREGTPDGSEHEAPASTGR